MAPSILCNSRIEKQSEHNHIHRFCLMDFLLYRRLRRLPMHAFLFCGWIEVLNPTLIICNYMSHQFGSSLILWFYLANKSQYSGLFVLESGNEETIKLQLSTFSTSRGESYGQMILKYPELEQVLSDSDLTIFSNYGCDCIYVNAQWLSNMGKQCSGISACGVGLCQWKIVESSSHSLSVYTLCINFIVSAADCFKRQLNFIAFLCSSNSCGITKTTFTKLKVTR